MATNHYPWNSIMDKSIESWFTYHEPTKEEIERMRIIRSVARTLAEAIATHTPVGADQSAALRKVREAVMTANAAIVSRRTEVR